MNPDAPPPGLPIVIAEVLVCAEQVEAGSLSFYRPLTEALGCDSLIDDEMYEQSFAPLWRDLTWWLETVNNGERGFPTWKSIPPKGPRSVIGRPYTQILLRREDWRDIEAFVEASADDDVLTFEIVDRDRVASVILEEFRRWATTERRVSARLLSILSLNRKTDLDTLSHLILERLADALTRGVSSADRSLTLAITLDDWQDRTLRVAVLAPDTPSTVTIEGRSLVLDEPGCPYTIDVTVTAAMLEEGLSESAEGGQALIYRPRDAIALASRSWDVWCSVRNVEPEERVYVLCRTELRGQVEALMEIPRATTGVDGVPEGWLLLGPSKVAAPRNDATRLRGLQTREVVIPQLRGGLRVQRGRVYLQGSPPDVVFPHGDTIQTITVDAVPQDHDGRSRLRLVGLDLSVGRHTITVNGMLRLDFDLVDPVRLGFHKPSMARAGDGLFVETGTYGSISGVVAVPENERWLPLLPATRCAVVVGNAPHMHRFEPQPGRWAEAEHLPFNAFDPLARMAYPAGQRPVPPFRPFLAAAQLADSSWQVVALPGFERIEMTATDDDSDNEWTTLIRELLTKGTFRFDARVAEHAAAWESLRGRLA